jgi:hypothetical protein
MLTLLLDLDDTLLDTNMDAFIPAYFQALSLHMSTHVQSEVMLPALVSWTRAMMASEDPAHTLKEVFDQQFYPSLGVEGDGIHAVIEDFATGLPGWKPDGPSTGVLELVRWAFERGHCGRGNRSFFPLKATEHRLRFAGLAPENHLNWSHPMTFHFTTHMGLFCRVFGRATFDGAC